MLVYLDQLLPEDWACFEALKSRGIVRSYPSNTVLYQQKDLGRAAHAVTRGLAKVTLISGSGETKIISYMTPGVFFGQSAAFLEFPVPNALTVVSATEVEMLSVPRDVILDSMQGSKATSSYMLKCAALQICNMMNQIEVSSFGAAVVQVASVLHSFPFRLRDGKRCVFLTHEEIASIIGKTRVTVSQCLHRLQQQGIIAVSGRKRIMIERPEALASMAGESDFYRPDTGEGRSIPSRV